MAAELTWATLDWAALDRLRDGFLGGVRGGTAYWTSASDLANYEFTYAQRIAWKWDAVLRELRERAWTPPPGAVLDWGCGSGIAGRRVLEFFGTAHVASLRLFDKSALATEFAARAARKSFPQLRIEHDAERAPDGGAPIGALVLSHVLNELTDADRETLRRDLNRSESVLWVEPGTHADSRELIAWRESLLDQFSVVAPCTHTGPCGMLATENERHWCHHFAAPPPGVLGDANWVRFARRAGIDLRRLPYSFLVLERRDRAQATPSKGAPGALRVIGEPRLYKGYAKLFCCQDDGVRELRLQKRVNPGLFRFMKTGHCPALLQCRVDGGDIIEILPSNRDCAIENDTAGTRC